MVKKILLGLLCILLAGVLGVFMLKSRQEDAMSAAVLEQINQQLSPLRTRKLEIEAEIDRLEKESDKLERGMATVSLLITDLGSSFMEQVALPLLRTDIPAMMLLSQNQFPDSPGCIALADFQTRIEDGWDYCVAWDGSQDFDGWYEDMSKRLADTGLTMPQTLYYEGDVYTEEISQNVQARGFNTIVRTSEEELANIAAEEGTPWGVNPVKWIASGAKRYLEQVVGSRGSVAFVIDQFDFDESEFTAMLGQLNQYQRNESLLVANLPEAREYRLKVSAQHDGAQNDTNAVKIQELEAELEDVNRQIQELLAYQQGG